MKPVLAIALLLFALTASAQTPYERSETYGPVLVHFDFDSVGPQGSRGVAVRMAGELNGRRMTFTLDTGASANVVSPRFAEAVGLRLLVDSVGVEGTGAAVARRAVADQLSIGNVTFSHVPFLVVETETGEPGVDQHLRHMRAMLGRPLLEALGRVTFDFDRRLMTAPHRPKRKQKRTRRSNLDVVDNTLLLTAGDSLRLIPDFGASHSTLDSLYFATHRESVERSARADTVYYAGIGGLVREVEYTLSDFPLTIDRQSFVLQRVTVCTASGNESRLGMDFFSRQHLVTFDLRRWRLSLGKP